MVVAGKGRVASDFAARDLLIFLAKSTSPGIVDRTRLTSRSGDQGLEFYLAWDVY
jgi:hypothetical protein